MSDSHGDQGWGQPPGAPSPSPGTPPPSAGGPGAPATPASWTGPGPAATPQGGAVPAWGAPPPTRPGIVPLRPLTLGDVYGGVIRTIRGNVQATVGAGVFVTTAMLVVLVPLGLWIQSVEPTVDKSGAPLPATIGESVPLLASLVVPLLLSAFLAHVVSRAVLGERVSLGQVWAATRGRLLAVVGAAVVSVVLMVLAVAPVVAMPFVVDLAVSDGPGRTAAFVLSIIVAVLACLAVLLWLWTRLAFVIPAIVIERVGVLHGFRRSWALTRGRPFWRVLGIRLLALVIVQVIANIITVPLAFAAIGIFLATGFDEGVLATVSLAVNALTTLVAAALTTPFTAGVDALLYIDQRIRREALDVTLIQAASAGTAGR